MRPPADALDLVAVVAEHNRGWVLDTIAQEVVDRVPGRNAIHYVPSPDGSSPPPLPPARAYFFTHYMLFTRHVDALHGTGTRSLVFFTHPRPVSDRSVRDSRVWRRATVMVSMCSRVQALLDAGVRRSRIAVVIPGTDPERFRAHARGHGIVGMCSSYQERKAPERVAEIVEALPHREFVLLGPGWREAPVFERLAALPNFRHVELEYDAYPAFYDSVDVFVSASELEGGPIPLLESMMANAVPVATRTGFAEDLIRHGENGFVCDVDAPASEFADLIEQAFRLDADVRATVRQYTWDAFAGAIAELAFAGTDRRRHSSGAAGA